MSIGDNLSIIDRFESIDEYNWKWDKKYKNILSMLSDSPQNLMEVMTLDWKLDDKYNEILAVLVKNKDANIKEIYDEIVRTTQKEAAIPKKEQDAFYKKIQRRTTDLYKLHLMAESTVMHIDNLDKYYFFYRLTLNGIFYVIINWFTTVIFTRNNEKDRNIFINLLKYHSDNALFQLFLFPHFEEKTLTELSSSNLYIDFMEYLKEICNIIVRGIRGMRLFAKEDLIEGTIPHILFWWPKSYPDNKSQYELYFEKGSTLRKFLTREMGWNWIDDAEISPNYNNDTVSIEKKDIGIDYYIRINKIENEAFLSYDKKKYKFRLRKYSDGSYAISTKSNVSHKDQINDGIKLASKGKLLDLIFSIRTKYKHPSSAKYHQLLDNDKKFRDTVNEMIEIIKANNQN